MHLIRKNKENGKCVPFRKPSSAKLFQPGRKLVVARAPVMPGLSVVQQKPFQRPMVKRRAYGKAADLELKKSSLGQKKRMNGMARLLARAGKGLHFKPLSQQKQSASSDTENSDSEEEEEKKPDRPFEPLLVWKSPHNGGEPKGLPLTPVKEKRADEYGVETEVTVLKPAPLHLYAKHDVFVPPVLAKWLRPHQREGVKFIYECVMGLKDYRGKGVILADGTYAYGRCFFLSYTVILDMVRYDRTTATYILSILVFLTIVITLKGSRENTPIGHFNLYPFEDRHYIGWSTNGQKNRGRLSLLTRQKLGQ